MKFKELLNEDQKKRLEQKNIECQILDISDLKNIDENFYILYPSIGESLDFLIKLNLLLLEKMIFKLSHVCVCRRKVLFQTKLLT